MRKYKQMVTLQYDKYALDEKEVYRAIERFNGIMSQLYDDCDFEYDVKIEKIFGHTNAINIMISSVKAVHVLNQIVQQIWKHGSTATYSVGQKTKKFSVVEDNGGGLTIVVFSDQDQNKVVYLHTGYEYKKKGKLVEDIKAIEDGEDPLLDWEDNEDDPQAVYDDMTSFDHGWEIVADQDGVYMEKMGTAARLEFSA